MRWINEEDYYKLHTETFVPLPFKIDVKAFEEQIEPYKHLFRDWGEEHLEKMFRKGISVVNMTGRLDMEVDSCIYPQDRYNEKYGTNLYDMDYRVPTEILDLPCFDCLEPVKKYMIRSAILWWKKGSFFYPHVDCNIPTNYLRFWGTNKAEDYIFEYEDDSHEDIELESGVLYMTDTAKRHWAASLDDDVYTFFFCFDGEAYDTLMELCHER